MHTTHTHTTISELKATKANVAELNRCECETHTISDCLSILSVDSAGCLLSRVELSRVELDRIGSHSDRNAFDWPRSVFVVSNLRFRFDWIRWPEILLARIGSRLAWLFALASACCVVTLARIANLHSNANCAQPEARADCIDKQQTCCSRSSF